MASRYHQGYYTPKNPEKYIGDVTKIRYMSSWEHNFHTFLDNNPNVIQWSSENIAIKYIKPTDGKVHRYFPDYWVKYKDKAGNIIQEIIEVKPLAQTKRSRKNSKHRLYEDIQYAINIAKWEAATKWCNANGIKFRIITEKKIFA